MFIQTDRQTDEREAVRQTDRQADRLAEEKTEMDRQNCAHRACVYMKSMAYESLYIFTFSGNALRQVLKHCNNNIAGNRLLRRSVGASCCSNSYSKVAKLWLFAARRDTSPGQLKLCRGSGLVSAFSRDRRRRSCLTLCRHSRAELSLA